MEHVLLVDSEIQHADLLSEMLRAISGQVTVCSGIPDAVALLRKKEFDTLIYSALPASNWRVGVESLRNAATSLQWPPEIVCFLRGSYRGPAERLYAERKGFRLIYEG